MSDLSSVIDRTLWSVVDEASSLTRSPPEHKRREYVRYRSPVVTPRERA